MDCWTKGAGGVDCFFQGVLRSLASSASHLSSEYLSLGHQNHLVFAPFHSHFILMCLRAQRPRLLPSHLSPLASWPDSLSCLSLEQFLPKIPASSYPFPGYLPTEFQSQASLLLSSQHAAVAFIATLLSESVSAQALRSRASCHPSLPV